MGGQVWPLRYSGNEKCVPLRTLVFGAFTSSIDGWKLHGVDREINGR